jgi:hypothetical protein
VIVATTVEVIDVVEILKFAEVAPAGIVTVAGKVAAVLLLAKLTTAPPGPAEPLKVAVTVAELPAATELGAIVNPESVAAVMVKVADCVLEP